MTTKLFSLGLAFTLATSMFAQDDNLVFDPSFNNGDFSGTLSDNLGKSYGRMKELNDSTYIYFSNEEISALGQVATKVHVKTVHSNGSISEYLAVEENYVFDGTTTNWYSYAITDVIPNGSTFVVVSNDKGPNWTHIKLRFFMSNPNDPFNPWVINENLVPNGEFLFNTTYNVHGGKGYMNGNSVILYANIQGANNSNFGQFVASGFGTSPTWSGVGISNDGTYNHHFVKDVLRMSTGEVLVLDNHHHLQDNYFSMAKVWSIPNANPTTATNFLVDWNSSLQTVLGERVNRLVEDDGRVWVLGARIIPVNVGQGTGEKPMARAQRFNLDGTPDNSIFDGMGLLGFNNYQDNEVSEFSDIIKSPFANNEYLFSGYTQPLAGGQDGREGIICQVNISTDAIAYLYEEDAIMSIYGMIAKQAANPEDSKILINALRVGNGTLGVGMGRLMLGSDSEPPVSIDENEQTQVLIYPNPSTDFVIIEFNSAAAQIEILDTQGKLIQTAHINSGEQISLKNEPSGFYFIRITSDQATTMHRIVKQ